MMRVGTQRRSKTSRSPNSTYRQSPTANSRSSPISSHQISQNNTSKSPNYAAYRLSPSPSPTLGETQKYAQDYHRLQVGEKHSTPRAISPSYAPRSPSPTFVARTQSPIFRTQSPDYVSSRKLNERQYLSASPNFTRNDYDSSHVNKMSSMRISDSKSPVSLERSSPHQFAFGSTSRQEKRISEAYTSGNYDRDGIDTSPIVKVSAAADRPSARRDSWDAIAKTRNILSHRSLESVANLTEGQLNAELNQKRDDEHLKFVNHEQRHQSQKYSNNVDSYSSLERSYGTTGNQYRNGIKAGGAAAVKVQPVPDGVLGQPVEFESK